MPQHKSAEKRVITNEKRRKRNVAVKSVLRNASRKVRAATTQAGLPETVREAHSLLDKAAKKGIIHKRTASRRKSRLALHANKVGKSS